MTEKSIEMTLKEICKERYGSILQFTTVAGIPYGTFDSILKRGIKNATVDNIIKICSTLNISADALARGEIRAYSTRTDVDPDESFIDLNDVLADIQKTFESANLIYHGAPIDEATRGVLMSSVHMIDLALKGSTKA